IPYNKNSIHDMTVISMQAIWLQDKQLSWDGEQKLPSPASDEALIRVDLAGICGTDLELLKGYYLFTGIPGHEFVGTVIEAPDNQSLIGKRVVGEINISCGECDECLVGHPRHCNRRNVLGIKNHHGAFAEFLTLPVKNLHTVPDTVTNEQAVFVEPIAAACNILEQLSIDATTSILIMGAGRLGQLIAQVLNTTGCNLEVCIHHLSQQTLLNSFDIKTITEKELLNRRYDCVIECSGAPSGLTTALLAVKPLGTIVLKSTYHGKAHFDLSILVTNEISLLGSRCGSYSNAIALLEQGKIDLSLLVDKYYNLVDFKQAFEDAARPGALKVLFKTAPES
ncbi:MAG: alcohol dehydrogenase catalytic domain-containing protein, partial [Thiohalomonadales bacterium]